MLIYTSGTTGKPKGAVHTHCGFPIKAAQDLQHGFDMSRQRHDVLGHRSRMDDGSVGAAGHDAARRDRRALRRRAGLSDVQPPLESRRRASRLRSGRLADADSHADARARLGARGARPFIASRARLHRRALESGSVAMVLRQRSAKGDCRSSTTRAAPKSPAASSPATC